MSKKIWKRDKFSGALLLGCFLIKQNKKCFDLKCGWNYIGTFPSEAGAKRVAACIYREANK